MPSIYLCGRYSRRRELSRYARRLETVGIAITSRWLLGGHEGQPRRAGDALDTAAREAYARCAAEDRADVYAASLVLAFTEPEGRWSRGGRHVVLGLALAWHKAIIVIGPMENVFYALPEVRVYPHFDDVLAALATAHQLGLA